MSSLAADVRYAARSIRQHPGHALVIALTLALGLGMNATMFGMMDALFLRPFQFRDYDRLVVVWESPTDAAKAESVAPANFLDWQREVVSVEGLVAWEGWGTTLSGSGDPERVQAFRVTPGFLELLGITPTLGRSFIPEEGRVGMDRRAILSDGFWKRRFASDPGIVGREIRLDEDAYTVVGVAPPEFQFPEGIEIWVPLAFSPSRALDREHRDLTVLGKLAADRTIHDAQAELDLVSGQLARQFPDTNHERGVWVRSLTDAFREGMTGALVGVLQAGAGLVLLVACANLASLLLARTLDRRRELSVRIALGASRGRIIRQIVTETVVLALLASTVALLLSYLGLEALRSSMPAETARYVEGWNNLRLDARLFVLIPAVAIAVGIVVGLGPAISASRNALMNTLKDADRGSVGAARQHGPQALVVAEIAFALTVLIAAALTAAGGIRHVNQPGGFSAERLLTLGIPLPEQRYGAPGTRREAADALLERIANLPDVENAALANVLPAAGWSPATPFVVEENQSADSAQWPRAGYRVVSPGYFEAMRVPLTQGRAFSSQDREGSEPVAIVSAAMAQQLWPDQDAVGRRLRLPEAGDRWLTVVGVSGDVTMYNWWDGVDYFAVYVPMRQAAPLGWLHVAVRARTEAESAAASVRQAVRAVDPILAVDRMRSMTQGIEESSLGLRYLAGLMAACGGIAFFLAVIGIYSTMTYAVSQRTHEFGVRLALGATAREVVQLTIRRAGILTAAGLAIGTALAWVFARLMSDVMFGIIAPDSIMFIVVVTALGLVSLAAAYVPARRALRLDPATILRG